MGLFWCSVYVFSLLRLHAFRPLLLHFLWYTPAAASLRTSGVPSAVYTKANHQRPCTMVCVCLVVFPPSIVPVGRVFLGKFVYSDNVSVCTFCVYAFSV